MAWRAIQDSVAESESLAGLSDFAERLYWRMLAQSDPWGRLRAEPLKIRARCIPLLDRPADVIAAALEELEAAGRILRYEDDGHIYTCIVGFDEHQPRDVLGRDGKRYTSRFPDPPENGTRSRAAKRGVAPAESEIEIESEQEQAPDGALAREQEESGAVQAVYDCWRTERGKTSRRYDRISPGRRMKIKARLKDFSAEDLCTAIRGVALDPWSERARHDDITVIFRSREQVERFLGFAETPDSSSGTLARASNGKTPLRYGRGMTTRQILDAAERLQ